MSDQLIPMVVNKITPNSSLVRKTKASPQDPTGARDKAVRSLARSIFRALQVSGYDIQQIVTLSAEILGLVTARLQSDATAVVK